jgi:hypothetical protein
MRKTLIKRKKTTNRRNRKRRTTRKTQRGGGLGSDLRQKLVTLCRTASNSSDRDALIILEKYDKLTKEIIVDNGKKKSDFLFHLEKNMSSFSDDTILCLERSLKRISGAEKYLEKVIQTRNALVLKGSKIHSQLVDLCKKEDITQYEDITQQIMSDWRNRNKAFFIFLDEQISVLVKKYIDNGKNQNDADDILCLERALTQLQEEGIPESMKHLVTVMDIKRIHETQTN